MMNRLRSVPRRIRDLYRRYGWKAVVGLVGYYLIRDLSLYVLLPYYIGSRLMD